MHFVDELTGEEEKGIDAGGPFKEFLEMLVRELFRDEFGLFRQTTAVDLPAVPITVGGGWNDPSDQKQSSATAGGGGGGGSGGGGGGTVAMFTHGLAEMRLRRAMARFYFPNPAARVMPDNLRMLQLVGRVVGKALYEGILLHVPLAPFFLCKAIGQPCTLSDLQLYDPQLYSNLMKVKVMKDDASCLCLNFAVSEEILGTVYTHELKPGGADIDVTDANKIEYIYAVADYHLNRATRSQSRAFVAGLTELVDPSWLKMFNVMELQLLLSGSAESIDPKDWQKYAHYDGDTKPTDKRMQWFWDIVSSFDEEERSSLLRFTTCCSRPPLGGFRYLHPPFTIRLVDPGDLDQKAKRGFFDRLFNKTVSKAVLPSSATCFNLLKLPKYESKEVMAEKLRLAISASGFHLS